MKKTRKEKKMEQQAERSRIKAAQDLKKATKTSTTMTTPTDIHEEIKLFCKTINPDISPSWIHVVPDIDANLSNCFVNVDRRISKHGGSVVYGWTIWEYPGAYLEAEFHAVWKSTSGEAIDISPKEDGESRILFLPDPTKSYQRSLVASKYRALPSNHLALVSQFIKSKTELDNLRGVYYIDNGGESAILSIPPHAYESFANLQAKTAALMNALNRKFKNKKLR